MCVFACMCVSVCAYAQNWWQLEFQFHQRALKIALLELKTRFCVCQDVCTYICTCMYELCMHMCVFAIVYLCKWPSNDLLSYLFINIDGKWYLHMYVCAVYTSMCDINIHTYEEVCISSLPLLHILLSFTLLALFVDSQMATTNNKNRSWTCPHSLLAHAHTHARTHVCVSVVALLISCVARLLCWGLFSLPLSLSFCSVITSVAEQETVNVPCLFTFLCLFPAVAVYPWFVVSFPFADNKENSQYVCVCVWVCTCVRIDLIMHMTDNLFM